MGQINRLSSPVPDLNNTASVRPRPARLKDASCINVPCALLIALDLHLPRILRSIASRTSTDPQSDVDNASFSCSFLGAVNSDKVSVGRGEEL